MLEVQRRDALRYINEDPWSITMYTRTSSGEIEETFTGRIAPSSARSSTMAVLSSALAGRSPVSNEQWVLFAPHDIADVKTGARIVATHTASGLTKTFEVALACHYPYKWEVLLDERK